MLSTNDAVLLLALVMLLLVELCSIVFADPYIRRDHRRVILIIIVLCFSLILQNLLEYRLSMGAGTQTQRTLTSIYGYSVRPVILNLFRVICTHGG